MDPVSLAAFRSELCKIAEDGLEYRTLKTQEGRFRLAKDIPVVDLPADPELARKRIIDTIDSREIKPVLGYENIAVPNAGNPTPEEMGFRPTRLATPLPGEKMFSTSWRRGRSHIHDIGPYYMIHRDRHAPMAQGSGYFNPRAIKHFVTEGIPSMVRRFTTETEPLVEPA